MVAGERNGDVGAGRKRPVLIYDRGVRVDDGACSQGFPGDHPHAGAAVVALRLRDPVRRNLLVARAGHLVARRQVHPDLEAVDAAALVADAAGRHLRMDDPRSGGHPLDIAWADHAAMPGRVFVLELPLEHVGHGLKAPVRVVGRADRLAGPVLDRPHLVEQEKGIGQLEPVRRQRAAHDEAAPFALTVRRDHLG